MAKTPQANAEAIVLTVEDVAMKLKLPVVTARKLVVSGKMVGFKVGNRWRVLNSEFDRYIDQRILDAPRSHRRPMSLYQPPTKNRFR